MSNILLIYICIYVDLHPSKAVGAVCGHLHVLSVWDLCGWWIHTWCTQVLCVCACWEHTPTAGWTRDTEVLQLLTSGVVECSVVHFLLTELQMMPVMMMIIIRIAITNVAEDMFLPLCLVQERGSQQSLWRVFQTYRFKIFCV